MFRYTIKKIKFFNYLLFFFIFCSLTTCSRYSNDEGYKVAFDPSWYSLNLPSRGTALTAFTVELFEAIAKIEKKKITLYQVNSNLLVPDLQNQAYDAICTMMEPHLFYEKTFTLSNPFLMTGPVIILPVGSTDHSLDQLGGKTIAVIKGSSGTLLLSKYPKILQRSYDSPPKALFDTSTSLLDGCLIDNLSADAFICDVFQNQLKIASPPPDKRRDSCYDVKKSHARTDSYL